MIRYKEARALTTGYSPLVTQAVSNFVTLRLNLGVSTFFCRLLLQMARIDMD